MEQEIKEGLLETVSDSRMLPLLAIWPSLFAGLFFHPDAYLAGAVMYDNYINYSNPNGLIRDV